MALPYTLGPRVTLPAYIAPYASSESEPATRSLWIYALDPATVGLREPVLKIAVPYERLLPGPSGALFAVAGGALHPDLVQAMDWMPSRAERYAAHPLDLNELSMALNAGLLPSTGDPRFAAQMTYAVCQEVYGVFRKALGRNPSWGPWAAQRVADRKPTALILKPQAFRDTNAYYDPVAGTLEFGFFHAEKTSSPYVLPGGLVFTALSRDIIAHELSHALLDGMRAQFVHDTHIDVGAFHEGFADIIAMLMHFSREELVVQALEESTRGLNVDLLLEMGKQFGEAINGEIGGALRRALKREESPDTPSDKLVKYSDPHCTESHDRGSILVSAIFEAFLSVYQRKAKPFFKIARLTGAETGTQMSAELLQLLASEVGKLAAHFLSICIRAIDYCPPVDIRFGEYLRALITADHDIVANDRLGYRDALIKAFRRRDIALDHVVDLSEDSLRWKAPDLDLPPVDALRFSLLRFTDTGIERANASEYERRAHALGRYVTASPERLAVFGLHEPGQRYGPVVVESIRLAHQAMSDGMYRSQLVAEVTQERNDGRRSFIGGATVLIGNQGNIRYLIRKRVDDMKRRHEEQLYAVERDAQKLNFKVLHKKRKIKAIART
ncbi:hypothetical protein [Noviherbaspirillum saxi]|uniref:Uncharacterized protein n=1 Tax=Noviherbaspirillum saxi TaxID=2320863 RepID=A0A3A3FHR0_9BURK|nr:hypothetical protein [Noviherbaspirillum saxi]RJF92044.1 hypothetical protein D3871_25650 [Noviherbaspirillum saxi]